MRRLFLAAIGLVFASAVSAQESVEPNIAEQEPQIKFFIARQACTNAYTVLESIKRYGEKPLFQTDGKLFHSSGVSFESNMMFFVNQDTGTWTLVAVYDDKTACVVAEGSNFEPYIQGIVATR